MSSIIQMVLDKNWADLTKVVEGKAADKLRAKITDKKKEIVSTLNVGMSDESLVEPSTH